MKFLKWRIFLITSVICLLPILFGILIWDKLPDTMAIHVDIYGTPDNFAPKGFVVFGLPILMLLLQAICCIINDVNAYKYGDRKKFERASKWIIPFLTVVLQVITLGYGLGWNLDIRRVVAVVVGIIFLIIGNYLPKFDYNKNYDVDTEKARKINRFIGYEAVGMGILFLISAFFPPIGTIVCLCLLIPYSIIGVVYGIITARK